MRMKLETKIGLCVRPNNLDWSKYLRNILGQIGDNFSKNSF